MKLSRQEGDGRAQIKIEGTISVYEVAALRDELVSCFAASEHISLDLTEATGCDVTGVQVLYSALKTAQSTGKTFAIAKASASIFDTLVRAGMEPDEIPIISKEV
jgi:anti-anti-sigma factor